ncbi:MAG: hypothetical protein AAF244_04435 [Pseudomonadota bacterium]
MRTQLWINPSKLTNKVVFTPELLKQFSEESILKLKANLHGFNQKAQNWRIIKFVGKQGFGAATLVGFAKASGDSKTLLTGAFNLARNAGWFGAHKLIGGMEDLATAPMRLQLFFKRAAANKSGSLKKHDEAENLVRKINKLRERVSSKFDLMHRNITHNVTNGVFAFLGAVVHVPQMLQGGNHFYGAGIALLGYLLLSMGYFDKGFKNHEIKEAILNGKLPYDPKHGHMVSNYVEDKSAKHIFYEVLPPLFFMAKGGFYIAEAAHVLEHNPLAAAFIAASGIAFISSGDDEFKHLNGYKIEAFIKHAAKEGKKDLVDKLERVELTINSIKNDFRRAIGCKPIIKKNPRRNLDQTSKKDNNDPPKLKNPGGDTPALG